MLGTVSWKLWRKTGPGMLVESFLEDEELARTALSCQVSLDLFCHEMPGSLRTAGRWEVMCPFFPCLLREDPWAGGWAVKHW